jgi:hypothetical protein
MSVPGAGSGQEFLLHRGGQICVWRSHHPRSASRAWVASRRSAMPQNCAILMKSHVYSTTTNSIGSSMALYDNLTGAARPRDFRPPSGSATRSTRPVRRTGRLATDRLKRPTWRSIASAQPLPARVGKELPALAVHGVILPVRARPSKAATSRGARAGALSQQRKRFPLTSAIDSSTGVLTRTRASRPA